MILDIGNLITLQYSPSTDVLEVEYPSLEGHLLAELKDSLTRMVEVIRHYDIKKLLMDASRTVILVSEEENNQVAMQLAAALTKTRIRKVARVQPREPSREARAQQYVERLTEAGLIPYQLRAFSSKEEALSWLVSPD